jgi:hypothetical protein
MECRSSFLASRFAKRDDLRRKTRLSGLTARSWGADRVFRPIAVAAASAGSAREDALSVVGADLKATPWTDIPVATLEHEVEDARNDEEEEEHTTN